MFFFLRILFFKWRIRLRQSPFCVTRKFGLSVAFIVKLICPTHHDFKKNLEGSYHQKKKKKKKKNQKVKEKFKRIFDCCGIFGSFFSCFFGSYVNDQENSLLEFIYSSVIFCMVISVFLINFWQVRKGTRHSIVLL